MDGLIDWKIGLLDFIYVRDREGGETFTGVTVLLHLCGGQKTTFWELVLSLPIVLILRQCLLFLPCASQLLCLPPISPEEGWDYTITLFSHGFQGSNSRCQACVESCFYWNASLAWSLDILWLQVKLSQVWSKASGTYPSAFLSNIVSTGILSRRRNG